MEVMPRLPKPSDRARGRLVRFAAWTSAAIVLAAMAFGGDDTASPDPVVAAGPPAQTVRVEPIPPGRRPPHDLPAPPPPARPAPPRSRRCREGASRGRRACRGDEGGAARRSGLES